MAQRVELAGADVVCIKVVVPPIVSRGRELNAESESEVVVGRTGGCIEEIDKTLCSQVELSAELMVSGFGWG